MNPEKILKMEIKWNCKRKRVQDQQWWIEGQWSRMVDQKEQSKKQCLIKIWFGKLLFWRMLDPV